MKRAVVAAVLVGACGHAPPKPSDSGDPIVYVRANVKGADVFVDGRFIGPVDRLRGGIEVAPGNHRIEVRREDYFSRYVMLELKRDERRKLEITLAPVLP